MPRRAIEIGLRINCKHARASLRKFFSPLRHCVAASDRPFDCRRRTIVVSLIFHVSHAIEARCNKKGWPANGLQVDETSGDLCSPRFGRCIFRHASPIAADARVHARMFMSANTAHAGICHVAFGCECRRLLDRSFVVAMFATLGGSGGDDGGKWRRVSHRAAAAECRRWRDWHAAARFLAAAASRKICAQQAAGDVPRSYWRAKQLRVRVDVCKRAIS